MAKYSHDYPHSTSIPKCEYDDETKEMHLTFATGGKHCFKDVSKEDYEAFHNSDSKGAHFHKEIRKRYQSVKVD